MASLKYQFIITYNVYENGVIAGMGMETRMSSDFYLHSSLQKEMIDSAADKTKENNTCKTERYIGDLKMHRFNKE